MTKKTIILLSGILFLPGAFKVEATWLIDPWKFHISSHGQTSCQDCHAEHTEEMSHPDPGNVDRKLADFFKPEHCFECHDDFREDLDSLLLSISLCA